MLTTVRFPRSITHTVFIEMGNRTSPKGTPHLKLRPGAVQGVQDNYHNGYAVYANTT